MARWATAERDRSRAERHRLGQSAKRRQAEELPGTVSTCCVERRSNMQELPSDTPICVSD